MIRRDGNDLNYLLNEQGGGVFDPESSLCNIQRFKGFIDLYDLKTYWFASAVLAFS